MSMYCEVCGEYHDHNAMKHIYKLEATLQALMEVAGLESINEYPFIRKNPTKPTKKESK